MQKIFIRYFAIIMVITVGLTLLGNFALQTAFAQQRKIQEAGRMLLEIARRIDDNERVIVDLTANLDENYISRAWALAEIVAQNPSVLESFDEMDRLAGVLHVDEVHVIDENGILQWGNVRAYYGMDFASTNQTSAFLPGLTDKSFALAQTPQPNGNEGKLFQYIGVARQDKPGIVQVGVAPEILDNALSNNRINAVIANYNVASGVNVTAYDPETGVVVGDSADALVGKLYSELGVSDELFHQEKQSAWLHSGDDKVFAVFGTVKGYLAEITFTKAAMFVERNNQTFVAGISSLLLGLTIIVAIFILLKRRIIGDLENLNGDLGQITGGKLDVVVSAKSTPETRTLSHGINEMVGSLKAQMKEISRQASDLEERNQNILASLKYAKKIQSNLLPSPKPFDETFSDYRILWEPRDEVGGDIYWMKRFEVGSVLCVCDCTGHGTPGALLTMLVVSALDSIVDEEKCSDPARVLWELEQRLVSMLNVSENEKSNADIRDGADLAILFIRKSGEIDFASAKLHIFICNGESVEDLRGQKLSIGDGSLKSVEQITVRTIPACAENTYYIVSDGLFEQVGGEGNVPFGYSRFKQHILDGYALPQTEVTDQLWTVFQNYMGSEMRRDDVTLISFKL